MNFQVPTGSWGSPGSGVDAGWLGDIASAGRSLFETLTANKSSKSRAKGGPTYGLGGLGYAQGSQVQLPPWLGGGVAPGNEMLASAFGSPVSSASFAGCFRMSDPSRPRVTPCSTVSAIGPDGRMYEWQYRGRPILYSRDVSIARHVNKLLGKRGRSPARRTKSRCR
jgi:hypothetical protein